jgi:hypothetical protein
MGIWEWKYCTTLSIVVIGHRFFVSGFSHSRRTISLLPRPNNEMVIVPSYILCHELRAMGSPNVRIAPTAIIWELGRIWVRLKPI